MTPHISSPSFCPRPDCPYYDPEVAASSDWYSHFGWYSTKARGRIRRFRCKSCGRTCSTQTFSIHYWTHSTTNFRRLFQALYSGSGLRQYARFINHSFRVVQNRIRHLSRNCLGLLDWVDIHMPLIEDLAMDGFESFTRSQYFPNNITLIAGDRSQFIYGAVHTLLRRKGSMSEKQKRNRVLIDAHWKPKKGALVADCAQLLSDSAEKIVAAGEKRPVILSTDEHPAYPLAIRAVPALRESLEHGRLVHRTISSRVERTTLNPLFPVNYVDRQMRKNMGEHVRETVKQGREVNCQMERMAIFMVGHNLLTPHRVRDGVNVHLDPTHTEKAGLAAVRYRGQLKRAFTHRQIWGHQRKRAGCARRIWQHEYENPPAVDFATGEVRPTVVAITRQKLPRHFLA